MGDLDSSRLSSILSILTMKKMKHIKHVVLEPPAQNRKEYPMFSGLLKYFPDALMEVSHVSFIGNQQHHKDKPLHWDRSKSTDEPDALMRHLVQSGTIDSDGIRHTAKVAWRALALLQKELENDK